MTKRNKQLSGIKPWNLKLEDFKWGITPIPIYQQFLSALLLLRCGKVTITITQPLSIVGIKLLCYLICVVCQVLNHCLPALKAPPLCWSIHDAVPSLLCAVAIETDSEIRSHTHWAGKRLWAVLLCNTVISTASSMLASLFWCPSIFFPLGWARGSCLCIGLHFSKNRQGTIVWCCWGTTTCFEFITRREKDRVNNLTDLTSTKIPH